MADVDYYALFGIPKTADAEQIKIAYRKKAREYHPDHAGPKGADAFHLITRAYRILSDPKLREVYDVGFRPVTSLPELYEQHGEGKKIMELMLPTAPAAKQIGLDLYLNIYVSPQTLKEGGNVTITLPGDSAYELVLQIPPGAKNNPWCRLPHQGSPGRNGGISGDLWIQLLERQR
jgi:DnaJ-class molecular chaperone